MSNTGISTPTGTNPLWASVLLILAVAVVPYLLTEVIFILFPELSRDLQLAIWLIFALLGLMFWIWRQGAGWRMPEKDTAVILKDSLDNYSVQTRTQGPFLFIPILQEVVALMPTYPLTYEIDIEKIDTQTRFLARINSIRVRATCTIRDPKTFYTKSKVFLDRILEIEATTKLRRTDTALWKQLLHEAMEVLIDNGLRDVVWRWQEHIDKDPSLKLQTNFTLKKLGELEPFDLSVNRRNLAREVTAEIGQRARELGVHLEPLVFESIEIEKAHIEFKNREHDRELSKAKDTAALEAIPLIARGEAEAQIRATTLAKLLDVLINEYKIPHTDPLVAQVVRASLYSDGEMIWKGVLEKSANGNGAAKTA